VSAPRIELDVPSLLADVRGEVTLGEIEAALGERGYTVGFDVTKHASTTVGEWLASGAPGAPPVFADPADHLFAGLEATLVGGRKLEVRPGPRRAVGPDLTALVVGTRGHLGTVDRVWLRIHRRDARRPALALPGVELDPPVSLEEAALMEAIARELGR